MLKMKNKILASLVIVMLLLLNTGAATTVRACSTNNTEWSTHIIYISSSANIQTKLDVLVALENISQDEEETIFNMFYDDEITTIHDFKAQLDDLVTKGTITQNQETTILNLFTAD